MSDFFSTNFSFICGTLFTIIYTIIQYYNNKKPKLVYYYNGYGFEAFNLKSKKIIKGNGLQHLYMNSIILFNSSKTIVKNIEVYLSKYIFTDPNNETCLSIYPEYKHNIIEKENVKIINFDYLSPKDQIKFSFLSTYPYNADIFITKIRSENGVAKAIATITVKKLTKTFIIFVNTFLYIGLLSSIIIMAKFLLLPLFQTILQK